MRYLRTLFALSLAIFATILTTAPKQALAADAPEKIAEALFGTNYEDYVDITDAHATILLTIEKDGATFQPNASINIADKTVALGFLDTTVSAPTSPITVSGEGSFIIVGSGGIAGDEVSYQSCNDGKRVL